MAHRPPLWLLRILLPVYRFSLGIMARLPGGRYARFIILEDWCKRAVERGNRDRASSLARELLELAKAYAHDWNHGNAVHHGHLVLGRIALATGDLATARTELIAAGRTSGSPQLNSFGPNMRLAQELLRAGELEVVLEYLELCRRFWKRGDERLAKWTADIAQGRVPDFGPNLVY